MSASCYESWRNPGHSKSHNELSYSVFMRGIRITEQNSNTSYALCRSLDLTSIHRRSLFVHQFVRVLHQFRVLMALTPTLATPGLRVSAVTAAAAGTVVTLEVMSLELIQSECFHFVISRLTALRAQAARLSAGAF